MHTLRTGNHWWEWGNHKMTELAWKSKAREMLFEQGLQPAEVAERLGYSVESIRKFRNFEMKVLGRTGAPSKSHSPRAYDAKKAVSQRHVAIGARLARYRYMQPDNMTAGQLGELLGVSRIRVREMELGFHDFSLKELERISKVLSTPLAELIQA